MWKRFQPGEGPCRGFLHDYEPSCGLGTFVWSSTWDTAPSYVTHQLGPWRQNTRIVGIQFGAMQGGGLIQSAFHSAYNRGLAEAVQSLQSWVGGNGVWCIIVIACTVFMGQNTAWVGVFLLYKMPVWQFVIISSCAEDNDSIFRRECSHYCLYQPRIAAL